jgi:hypothetical protein
VTSTNAAGIWHLDENAGSSLTNAMGGTAGSASNTSWLTGANCKSGSCLGLNGSSSLVTLNGSFNWATGGPTAYTVLAWVYMASTPGDYYGVFSDTGGANFRLMITSSRYPYVNAGNRNDTLVPGPFQLPVGSWFHIAMAQSGSTVNLYVNGAFYASTSAGSSPFGFNYGSLYLGNGESSGSYKLNGRMDEAGVYNRVLTLQEIQDRYNAGREIETTGGADPNNCGSCGTSCSSSNIVSRVCNGGSCTGACVANYADCDGNKQTNGCEVSLLTDATNCGGCGQGCSTNHISRACGNGSCEGATCHAGYADCNSNKRGDGCEINVDADAANCGSCGAACSTSNIARACGSGSCEGGACIAPYADCNGNKRSDGCEVNTNIDAANCGACGAACSTSNIVRACGSGSCEGGTCTTGYADCNSNKRSDGCETSIRPAGPAATLTHCGSCGGSCSYASFPQVAQVTCSTGSCDVASCNAGYANCDGVASNGCETATTSDPNHCGGCGACPAVANATATCTNGTCGFTCSGSYLNCDGSAANGCEWNPTSSIAGYWPLNEGSGSTFAAAYGSPSGTVNSGTTWTSSTPTGTGYALRFNHSANGGSGSNATVGVSFSGSVTLEAWIYITSHADYDSIFSDGSAAFRYLINPGLHPYIDAGIHSDYEFTGFTFSQNTWYHIAMVISGGTATLYVNGNAWSGSTTTGVQNPFSRSTLVMGTSDGHPFNGYIDEPAVWNRALSAAEVLAHYNQKKVILTACP